MEELRFGATVLAQRRRLGLTQEKLAQKLGVSKGAVSKWETNASYPDITLLPRLAALFGISVDELIGYQPQLGREEIRRLYRQLAREFATQPFGQALAHCRELAREYCACFLLLLRLAVLLINYSPQAGTPQESAALLEEAMEWLRRVKQESGDARLASEALHMEALCLLNLGRPQEVLELLPGTGAWTSIAEPLVASAYHMTGRLEEAREVLQAGLYQCLAAQLNLLGSYLRLCRQEAFPPACQRALGLLRAFSVGRLHPGLALPLYLDMAHGWLERGDRQQALDMLEEYAALATGPIFPMRLHGDAFFDQLDGWLDRSLDMGDYPPRDEAAIRRSLVQGVEEDPALAPLGEEPRFQALVRRLKEHLEG